MCRPNGSLIIVLIIIVASLFAMGATLFIVFLINKAEHASLNGRAE